MKYRQYKIVHFAEIEDKQFGRAWCVQANTARRHHDSNAEFQKTDLYSKGEFSEYFIVPYYNYVVDEIEDFALRGALWSPDTVDWAVDKDDTIVNGIPVITHHYRGELKNKAKKPDEGNSRILPR